ncbi:GIY-YIG nuclease family protein [Olivibacter sp. XZL3]|uniref:GIY-YIG nuclease family protein n=1 Tax=Olivibacter sp. XZL3 TaxID=1735116 RepID=UPI0010665F76|nr:GIY-YIG nuclease family protein [Olivibacter sp. XZL3]
MEYGGSIYILTNKTRTTLYIGVTKNLRNRITQHKMRIHPESFSNRYNLEVCVYYENFSRIEEAIAREKQLKKWSRLKKELLINSTNPAWNDLWNEISEW